MRAPGLVWQALGDLAGLVSGTVSKHCCLGCGIVLGFWCCQMRCGTNLGCVLCCTGFCTVTGVRPAEKHLVQDSSCAVLGRADLPEPVPDNLLRFTLDFRLTSSAKPRFEQLTHIKVCLFR